jgi:hypothetical protein
LGASGSAKYLENSAVKSDQVLFDQRTPGIDILIQAHFQKRADLVVAVKGKAKAVCRQDQKEIEHQLVGERSLTKPPVRKRWG